jgi:hypothetical protein
MRQKYKPYNARQRYAIANRKGGFFSVILQGIC